MYTNKDHTFSICAYKESPYLEDCIKSVLYQGSRVLVVTSTPNELIRSLCSKYNLELFVNTGRSGIDGDWNFAIEAADTALVTITHQDDVYCSNYARTMLDAINSSNNPLMFCSNYGEIRNGKKEYVNNLLKVKRLMSLPLRINGNSRAMKRLSIAFGNAICCPSATYVKSVKVEHPFINGMKSNLDWQLWEELSNIDGEFLYSDDVLMFHRIHEESETSRIIGDNARGSEDLEMFRKFWPEPVAKAICRVYSNGEKSNEV